MKERKKRTTNKEAYDNGFKMGEITASEKFIILIDTVLDDYEQSMYDHPRNTKFIEIEMDAIKEFKEKVYIFLKHREKN